MGRVPKEGEPWFTEEDTAAVLEWQREKELRCSGCGLPNDETMQKEAQFRYTAKPIRCHACAARDRAALQMAKAEHDDAGLMWTIEEIDG